ncbi:MAG: aminotransferase class I/II-fold pyridoxal phosphate-dependent enzyme, partial [Chthoniobacterales bacterium]|nr:aminotransferase class I/II-fold pyridoxal phosphate-dependent enzyme [Chthoniobacterales bacterium]
LAGKEDVILLDKLCHASLIDGAKLSGAALRVFPHNHLGKLESHLEWAHRERPDARILIVTESVFSMDGDRTPLSELIDLKKRFGAMLLLDEAHAIGVLGPAGRGLAAELNLTQHVDVQMGTLSKALGVSGGYVCGSHSLIDWFVNRARSFIFSTAPPPALAAAALAAIEFLQSEDGKTRRRVLWERIKLLRRSLPTQTPVATATQVTAEELGSAIHVWPVGDERTALNLARSLRGEGLLVPAIRYPTVARGSARLRITVTAAHHETQILSLCEALARHVK